MPHQQLIADVLGEIDDRTGRLAYSEGGVTIPRQQGKTTFIEAKFTHRCTATGFFGPRQRLVYTAQTRLKAREKLEEDFIPDLEAASAWRGRFRTALANGNEHIRFANGSRFGLEASTEKAGHGGILDEAYLDRGVRPSGFPAGAGVRPGDDHPGQQAADGYFHGWVAGRVAVPGGEG
jgi:hypothetical protein